METAESIAENVLYHFYGNINAAITYCDGIANNGGYGQIPCQYKDASEYLNRKKYSIYDTRLMPE